MKLTEKKVIFVNNPAAINGGALTILKQFIVNVAQKCSHDYNFYIFCTADLKEFECNNIKIITDIKAKKWKDRIYWDTIGLRKWSEKKYIIPNLVISLQNTGVGSFSDINQIVYLHQSLPYYEDIKWNPFIKRERKYWFYRYIYKLLIDKTIRNKYLVVQCEWMKQKVSHQHKINKRNIFVIKPNFNEVSTNKYIEKDTISLFYPASSEIYKNHEVLFKSIKNIKQERNLKDIKLYLTLEKNNSKYLCKLIKKYNIESNVIFLGVLSYEEVMEYYQKCSIVVFPSYVETIGLPLIEAAQYGKPIIVSDFEYSREALDGYDGVKFVQFNNEKEWSQIILEQLNNEKKYKYFINNKGNSWDEFIRIISECENW